MYEESKVELIIETPDGEKSLSIWDRNDLEDSFLSLGKERLEDIETYFTDPQIISRLTYAVENDLGNVAYKLFIEARDIGEPYSSFEFVDEEGNGEDEYEYLIATTNQDDEFDHENDEDEDDED